MNGNSRRHYGPVLWLALVFVAATPVVAAAQESPYTGHAGREIKALSQGDIEGLLEGRGMGLALAAELNSYPGPRHLLELADSVRLSSAQLEAVTEIFGRMESAAQTTGRSIVDLEASLDSLFTTGAIDPESLERLTGSIAGQRGELRRIHLAAHLETRALLSDHQVMLYDRLRGYGDGGHESEHRMGEH